MAAKGTAPPDELLPPREEAMNPPPKPMKRAARKMKPVQMKPRMAQNLIHGLVARRASTMAGVTPECDWREGSDAEAA